MIKLLRDMDPESLTIYKDNKNVGFVQWHNGQKRLIMWEAGVDLSLDDLKYIVHTLENK